MKNHKHNNVYGRVDEKRRRNALRICDFVLLAVALFLLLTTLAMILYPGSHHLDPNMGRYSFSGNFFSDLGATRTYNGQNNYLCMVLFIVAISVVGLALILFGLNYWVIYMQRENGLFLGRISVAAAVFSGLGFIGIGATPWNINIYEHMHFVNIAFIFMLIFSILFYAMQLLNGWDWKYVYANAFYIVLLALYVALLRMGVSIDNRMGLAFHVICQKVIVYSSLANLAMQAYGEKKALS